MLFRSVATLTAACKPAAFGRGNESLSCRCLASIPCEGHGMARSASFQLSGRTTTEAPGRPSQSDESVPSPGCARRRIPRSTQDIRGLYADAPRTRGTHCTCARRSQMDEWVARASCELRERSHTTTVPEHLRERTREQNEETNEEQRREAGEGRTMP